MENRNNVERGETAAFDNESLIRELKRKNELITSILNALPDKLIIIGKDYVVQWSSSKELEGKLVFDFTGEDKKKYYDAVFSKGKKVDFETECDGNFYWHVLVPCNMNGTIHTVLELKRDITAKKKIMEFEEIKNIMNGVIESQKKLGESVKLLTQNR